jgi:hypothetical protein
MPKRSRENNSESLPLHQKKLPKTEETEDEDEQSATTIAVLDDLQLGALRYSLREACLTESELLQVIGDVEKVPEAFPAFHDALRIVASAVARTHRSLPSSTPSFSSPIGGGGDGGGGVFSPDDDDEEPVVILKEVSFIHPRKKLDLRIHRGGLVLQNGSSGKVEQTHSRTALTRILCLPTPPELNSKRNTVTITLFFKPNTSTSTSTKCHNNNSSKEEEELVVVYSMLMEEGIASVKTLKDTLKLPGVGEEEVVVVVVAKEESESFKNRKNGACSVECNVKNTKDGHLYLLEEGLFFGFKKPLLWIDTLRVTNLTFDSATPKRIFSISVTSSASSATHVFSMIHEREFSAVSDYVRRLKTRLIAATARKEKRNDEEEEEEEEEEEDEEDQNEDEKEGEKLNLEEYHSDEDETFEDLEDYLSPDEEDIDESDDETCG